MFEETFGHGRPPVTGFVSIPSRSELILPGWLLTLPEVTGVADGERALPVTTFNGDPPGGIRRRDPVSRSELPIT
jgi:hypothetical protein